MNNKLISVSPLWFGRRVVLATALATTLGSVGRAASIFDDDWTPPATGLPVKPAAPVTPAPGPAVAPVAPKPAPVKPPPVASGAGSPQSTGSSGSTAPTTKESRPKETKEAEGDPQAAFDSIYGAEARKVAATPATKDDADFAQKLIEAARQKSGAPKLQSLLYEKTAEFGAKDPTGYAVALEALDSLRQSQPQRAAVLDEKYLAICEKQYAATPVPDRRPLSDPFRDKLLAVAADKATAGRYDDALALCRKATDVAKELGPDEVAEVGAVSKQIAERQRLDKKVNELKLKVEGPGTRPTVGPAVASAAPPAIAPAAKELVELLAGALDSPAKAKPYASLAADPALTQCIDLALSRPGDLQETQVLQLADWYKSLADKTDRSMPTLQATLLRRASGAYAHFMQMHTSVDSTRLKAMAANQQIASALDKAGKAAVQTTSLLSRVIPDRHAVAGKWQFQQKVLVADASVITGRGAALMIPVMPQGNYEISVEFASQDASEIGLSLPIAGHSVNLMRLYSSASMFYVNHTMQNMAQNLQPLSTDHDHHVLYAKVLTKDDEAGVLVKLDGIEVGRWEGSPESLDPVSAYETPDQRLPALCVWQGRAGFFGAALRMLSGAATRVDVDVRKTAGPTLATTRNVRPGVTVARNGTRPGANVGANVADPTALPADGTAPADGQLRKGFASHDAVTCTFTTLPGGAPGVLIEIADLSDESRLVRNGFPRVMESPDNVSNLRLNVREYRDLLAMSQQTPRGYSDAEAAQVVKAYGNWANASDAAKPAAEHALYASIHTIGENYKKVSAAWVLYVRQNTSDALYQLILRYGRYTYLTP